MSFFKYIGDVFGILAGRRAFMNCAQMSDSNAKTGPLHIDINTDGPPQMLPPVAAAFLVKFDIRKGYGDTSGYTLNRRAADEPLGIP